MDNQQFLDYIRQQLALGTTKENLQKYLSTSGWLQQDIDEAFAAVSSQSLVKERSVVGKVLHFIWRAIEVFIVLVLLLGGGLILYIFSGIHKDVSTGQATDSEKEFLISINSRVAQGALEIYKSQNRVYPVSLNELSPTYIATVPINPVTNQPFQYQVEQGGMNYQLCTEMNGQNACANASTTIDGYPTDY